jgi:hypothetical protein
MRDSVTMEIGGQTVGARPAGGAAVSPSAAARGRWLWAILSILFVLGIALSTIMERSERNGALDAAVERAHNDAQLATAALTHKQLIHPLTGSSYDRLAAKLWRSVSSDGTVAGVTIWSSHGRILFSLNESLVGKTPPEMRSLIMAIEGSGSSRVLDEQLQTFTPVSKATSSPVIVEIDQPISVVEARVGNVWSMLRLGFGVGLAVSLLFLVLAFVRPRLVGARRHEERPENDERPEGDVGAQMNAEGQPKKSPTATSAPTYEEVFGLQQDFDQTVEHDGDLEADLETPDGDPGELDDDQEHLDADPEQLDADPEQLDGDPEQLDGDPEALKSIRQWDEKYEGMVQEELKTQELMRQRREEFKARAEAAALRVKKLEAEPDEAPPTTD